MSVENQTVLQEILELNNDFNTGMYWIEYCSRKKLLKVKIDYEFENKLNNAVCAMVRGYITKDEFHRYKESLERTKTKYKELLLELC